MVRIVDSAVAAEPLVISRLVVKMDAMVKSGERSLAVINKEPQSLSQTRLPLWPLSSVKPVRSIVVDLKMNG